MSAPTIPTGTRTSGSRCLSSGLVLTAYTDHTVIWSLMEWDVGGKPFWGDNQEFYPAERFRRIARGELQLGGAGPT